MTTANFRHFVGISHTTLVASRQDSNTTLSQARQMFLFTLFARRNDNEPRAVTITSRRPRVTFGYSRRHHRFGSQVLMRGVLCSSQQLCIIYFRFFVLCSPHFFLSLGLLSVFFHFFQRKTRSWDRSGDSESKGHNNDINGLPGFRH